MSVTKKVDALNAAGKSIDEKLYMVLSAMDFTRNGYRVSELGEGIGGSGGLPQELHRFGGHIEEGAADAIPDSVCF